MLFRSRHSATQNASALPLVLTGAFVAIAVWVQATGKGIDLLALAFGVLIALALERTVGDWLAELIGAFPAGIVFTLAIVGTTWMLLDSQGGRKRTEDFFIAAEARGYTTVIFTRSRQPERPPAGPPPAPMPQTSAALPTASVRPGPAPAAAVATAGAAGQGSGETAPARTSGSSPSPATGSTVGWLLGAPRPGSAPTPTTTSVGVEPSRSRVGAAVQLRASVTARGRPLTTGTIAFTVDGVPAGSAPLGPDGTAAIRYLAMVPGIHEVGAYLVGNTVVSGSSASVTLHVTNGPR